MRLRLDLLNPHEDRIGLGDGFRVHVQLIVWEAENLVQVPQAALFRDGDGWAVFVQDVDRARHRRVEIGRQVVGGAEVLAGLDKGAQVVLYPARTLADGQKIISRD
ncbi:MAG: hypothetical protein IKD58_01980 [Loktanella sp.]|nr:hypothetical protein [Loktanella sp.]